MAAQNNMKRSIRDLVGDKNKIVVLPGVFDALSARIAEKTGFDAVFQTGYGSSATILGMPDFGFLNASETIDNARRIINAVNIPVIVDADTGYGNPLNVWRLVCELEGLGAAGIFLEDQVWPKRCGHMRGKDVVSPQEYILKLKAAIQARKSKDFVIVARTDARAPLGLDDAIKRAKLYRQVGADMIFVEAPHSVDELKRIAEEVDAPLVANMIEEGVTPNLSAKDLFDIGYKMALFPLSGLFASTYAIKQVFTELKDTGTTKKSKSNMVTFNDFNQLVDLQKYMTLEKEYT